MDGLVHKYHFIIQASLAHLVSAQGALILSFPVIITFIMVKEVADVRPNSLRIATEIPYQAELSGVPCGPEIMQLPMGLCHAHVFEHSCQLPRNLWICGDVKKVSPRNAKVPPLLFGTPVIGLKCLQPHLGRSTCNNRPSVSAVMPLGSISDGHH